jgi:carbonic anhydrase/acetyltransferase-like protein (isoleucine patch superfamily)
MNPLRPFRDKMPVLGERVYIDPACTIIGDVELADDVSVWPGTVIRGDVNHVPIGDYSLIGMGACILDGARVERHGFVGAGAVIGPGKVVGEGELWVGNPARPARTLSDKEIEALHYSADHYVRLKDEYRG